MTRRAIWLAALIVVSAASWRMGVDHGVALSEAHHRAAQDALWQAVRWEQARRVDDVRFMRQMAEPVMARQASQERASRVLAPTVAREPQAWVRRRLGSRQVVLWGGR